MALPDFRITKAITFDSFPSPEERLRAATEYIRGGFAPSRTLPVGIVRTAGRRIFGGVNEAGINVEAEEARGALLILCKEEGHRNGVV